MNGILKSKKLHSLIKTIFFTGICISIASLANTQTKTQQASKKISPDLFGLFFEDINYSADGGLYTELVQNRSFKYSAPAMSLMVIRIKTKQ